MNQRILLACIITGLLPSLSASAQQGSGPGRVRHVPPAEAPPNEVLELVAKVDRAWEANLEVRYRAIGQTDWAGAVFTRRDQVTYVVNIPAETLLPPGIEYFIQSTGAEQQLHFASAEAPHRINIFRSPVEVRRRKHLVRHDNRRAQIHITTEYIDYGTRAQNAEDRYLRVDAGVGYRLLNFPLKTLRFGYTYLLGNVPLPADYDPNREDNKCQARTTMVDCQVGFKGGGWFELRFLLTDDVELDGRGMVMATQEGFSVGGRAELRIGRSQGTHLGLGAELIDTVGTTGFVRLAWATVPGLPMAATVEVSDFPASFQDVGVRLLYDVARPLANGARLGLRVGYQARDRFFGGLALGLNASLDF